MNKSLVVVAGIVFSFMASCAPKEKPPLGQRTFLYSFEPTEKVTPDLSKKLISKFLGRPVKADLYQSAEDTVYYVSAEDVSERFEQDLNNGNFSFSRSMKGYSGDHVPKLPSSDEARKLAEQFLTTNGLMPRNHIEFSLAHAGGLRSSSVIDGKKAGPVIDELVTLSYGRTIDQIPVIGPGSKIVVNLGNKGEVMGVIRRWREIAPASRREVPEQEMVSQQEAEELARRQIISEYGNGTEYKVLATRKAYYDNNGSILQPVYMFEVAVRMRDQNVKPFNYLCVIQGLKNSPEPLQLTAVDPRAKELIKNIKRGEVTGIGSEGQRD